MITPSVVQIKNGLNQAFAYHRSLGIYNRRKIAGTNTWSQHAWGNAYDVTWPLGMKQGEGQAYLDGIAKWLRAQRATGALPIGTILWRVRAHYDHIHVEGKPKQYGTPPQPEEDDMKEIVMGIQENLNKAGFKGANGKVLTVDGDWGPNTQHAHLSMVTAAAQIPSLVGRTFEATISK